MQLQLFVELSGGVNFSRIAAVQSAANIVKGNELVNMAGRWNVGIEVSIIKPYTYSHPKCIKGKVFCVYNRWDSRDINIDFCEGYYEWYY